MRAFIVPPALRDSAAWWHLELEIALREGDYAGVAEAGQELRRLGCEVRYTRLPAARGPADSEVASRGEPATEEARHGGQPR